MSRTALMTLIFTAGVASPATPDPEAGKYYTYDQLGIKKLEVVGSTIKLTFQPVAERAYWCPGINVKETPKAVIVTFVRCETFKTCPTSVQAKIGKKLIRTISISTRGKNTYVKNGPQKYKKIHSVKETKVSDKKKSTPPKPSEVKQPRNSGWIENELIRRPVAEKGLRLP